MSAFGRTFTAARRSRGARLGIATGLAALALPLVGATAAHAATTTADVSPLASMHVTEPYGVAGPWAAGHHTGVDLRAAVGTQVRSVGAGTVVRSGWDGAYGNDVVIRMTDGDYTLYGHLSHVSVRAGQHVTAGEQVGLSGATGHATGPHLHFEVRTRLGYGSDINPLKYLAAHGAAV